METTYFRRCRDFYFREVFQLADSFSEIIITVIRMVMRSEIATREHLAELRFCIFAEAPSGVDC